MNSNTDSSNKTAVGLVMPSGRLTYSVAEAAVLLGISVATIYRLIAKRALNPIPGLRHKRIPRRQVYCLADAEVTAKDGSLVVQSQSNLVHCITSASAAPDGSRRITSTSGKL